MESSESARSWNDPPIVKFESVAPTKKHHLLSKKSGNETKDQASASDQSHDSSKNLMNDINVEHSLSSPTKDCSSINPSNPVLSDEEKLSFIVDTLNFVLLDCTDKSEQNVKEINRRIDVMKESWNLKLSSEVKDKMFHLAQELEKGNVDAALEVHRCLMVQNVREVKNWMVGVKHIIEMKKKKKLSMESIENINT